MTDDELPLASGDRRDGTLARRTRASVRDGYKNGEDGCELAPVGPATPAKVWDALLLDQGTSLPSGASPAATRCASRSAPYLYSNPAPLEFSYELRWVCALRLASWRPLRSAADKEVGAYIARDARARTAREPQ
jgi:hypothetical protein